MDWTQIVLALISMIGTAITAFFATRAKTHASQANVSAGKALMSADVALSASLRPAPENIAELSESLRPQR